MKKLQEYRWILQLEINWICYEIKKKKETIVKMKLVENNSNIQISRFNDHKYHYDNYKDKN